MLILKGRHEPMKIFADKVEQTAISQSMALCNQSWIYHPRGMPDIHAGAGCTIGTTYAIFDALNPNHVGVDQNCGMFVVKLAEKDINYERLDAVIRAAIPLGFHVNPFETQFEPLNRLKCKEEVNLVRARQSIGSLGGGNHFIEIDEASDNTHYLIIHTGSRNIGKQVADYYMELAGFPREDKEKLIAMNWLKSQGKYDQIQSAIEKINKDRGTVPYIEGKNFDNYLHDIGITKQYADLNRETIAERILNDMRLTGLEHFHTVHNYIDLDNMIMRKGAVSAQEGELLVIPMNMRDGVLLCRGKGNEDWNFSAPHGAGRIMSRGQAKRELDMEEFKESMSGVYTSSVSEATIDEAPMAYKPMEEIIKHIGPTVDVLDILKPKFNIKDDTKKKRRRR